MPAPEIGSLVHIVIWLPLLVYLCFSPSARDTASNNWLDRFYSLWRIVVIAVLVTSLAYDIREVAVNAA